MLGNSPATLLRKNMRTWNERAPVICAAFCYDLLTTISEKTPAANPRPDVLVQVSSEGEDDFHPIVPPPSRPGAIYGGASLCWGFLLRGCCS